VFFVNGPHCDRFAPLWLFPAGHSQGPPRRLIQLWQRPGKCLTGLPGLPGRPPARIDQHCFGNPIPEGLAKPTQIPGLDKKITINVHVYLTRCKTRGRFFGEFRSHCSRGKATCPGWDNLLPLLPFTGSGRRCQADIYAIGVNLNKQIYGFSNARRDGSHDFIDIFFLDAGAINQPAFGNGPVKRNIAGLPPGAASGWFALGKQTGDSEGNTFFPIHILHSDAVANVQSLFEQNLETAFFHQRDFPAELPGPPHCIGFDDFVKIILVKKPAGPTAPQGTGQNVPSFFDRFFDGIIRTVKNETIGFDSSFNIV